MEFIKKLESVKEKYELINEQLSDPEVYGNQEKYVKLNKVTRVCNTISISFNIIGISIVNLQVVNCHLILLLVEETESKTD